MLPQDTVDGGEQQRRLADALPYRIEIERGVAPIMAARNGLLIGWPCAHELVHEVLNTTVVYSRSVERGLDVQVQADALFASIVLGKRSIKCAPNLISNAPRVASR